MIYVELVNGVLRRVILDNVLSSFNGLISNQQANRNTILTLDDLSLGGYNVLQVSRRILRDRNSRVITIGDKRVIALEHGRKRALRNKPAALENGNTSIGQDERSSIKEMNSLNGIDFIQLRIEKKHLVRLYLPPVNWHHRTFLGSDRNRDAKVVDNVLS